MRCLCKKTPCVCATTMFCTSCNRKVGAAVYIEMFHKGHPLISYAELARQGEQEDLWDRQADEDNTRRTESTSDEERRLKSESTARDLQSDYDQGRGPDPDLLPY